MRSMADQARHPILPWAVMALAAALLFARQMSVHWPLSFDSNSGLNHVILIYSTLPRAAVALLAGAALGLSGLLLQRVLRNPLAEPSTLGISAGAQLAMASATIYSPALMGYSPGLVAFMGGIAAVALILSLTWRRGLEPVSVALAGMMVALTANSASAALVLANGEYLFSLFIWGGGSLVQQSWDPAITIGTRLAAGLMGTFLLVRPLAILGLDDASARGLGVSLHLSRFLIVALAVWIATTVAAEVGIIGFVGLAAPALASLSSARSLKQRLVATPLIGAVLLWFTDGLVQLAAGPGGERVPTGAATALLGGPILLWLLPRLSMFEWPSLKQSSNELRRTPNPLAALGIIGFGLTVLLVVGLGLGRGPDGWSFAKGTLLADLLEWRFPRVGLAIVAGGLLGAAGVVIQRVTSNPLASPEVLGVGTGAGAGLAVLLILGGTVNLGWQLAASAAGALLVLAVILSIAARGNLGPERLLFAGIAMNALCSSVVTAVVALGNAESYVLLRWLSGSTSDATSSQVWYGLTVLSALAGFLMLMARWLEVLPLGSGVARSLGLSVRASRNVLIALSALASAFAAMVVGPLSFVGLIAPHLTRLVGLVRAREHLAGSILLGAALMVASDWLSRMAAFPYQLPVGLFASLLGGPYLIYLLAKGIPRHG